MTVGADDVFTEGWLYSRVCTSFYPSGYCYVVVTNLQPIISLSFLLSILTISSLKFSVFKLLLIYTWDLGYIYLKEVQFLMIYGCCIKMGPLIICGVICWHLKAGGKNNKWFHYMGTPGPFLPIYNEGGIGDSKYMGFSSGLYQTLIKLTKPDHIW